MKKKKIKLGLYGCGSRTRALLESVRMEEECEVSVAFDARKEATETLVAAYGGRVCESADELVSSGEADAFVISLSPFAHPEAFDRALDAGKPVFIEKPVAVTAREVHRMMRKAQERNVPVHVGFMRRYYPAKMFARAFMAEHNPGRVFSVNGRWLMAGECEMVNCRNYHQKFGEEETRGFRSRLSQIPYHCCHMLDVLRLLGGDVRRVHSVGVKTMSRPYSYPSPDELIAELEYESGAIGVFHFSSVTYKFEMTYSVHAENYSISILSATKLEIHKRPPLRTLREDASVMGAMGVPDCRPTYMKHIGPDCYQFGPHHVDADIMLDFLSAVRDGTPMKVTMTDAYKVAELAEAIEVSWREQRPVALPMAYPDASPVGGGRE